jgi:hypothetical protein
LAKEHRQQCESSDRAASGSINGAGRSSRDNKRSLWRHGALSNAAQLLSHDKKLLEQAKRKDYDNIASEKNWRASAPHGRRPNIQKTMKKITQNTVTLHIRDDVVTAATWKIESNVLNLEKPNHIEDGVCQWDDIAYPHWAIVRDTLDDHLVSHEIFDHGSTDKSWQAKFEPVLISTELLKRRWKATQATILEEFLIDLKEEQSKLKTAAGSDTKMKTHKHLGKRDKVIELLPGVIAALHARTGEEGTLLAQLIKQIKKAELDV